MDNDGPGQEGAEIFAKKLGVERCLIVRPSGKRGWIRSDRRTAPITVNDDNNEDATDLSSASSLEPSPSPPPSPPKDANEALLQGWDLNELLEEASELPHERILKFSDLRDQVIHEIINPDKYRGTPVTSLPGFTSLIKGFRRGEMTVLTGPTGSGKTTFLGQISLDLAEQGTNVLWGSFEIKNTRLMHKLLQQYMRDVLPMGLATRDNLTETEKRQQLTSLMALADKFESLPMHFLKFHGGSDVDHVLDAMEYAAYVYDVDHIILDNMQFMISRTASQAKKGGGSAYDKFDMQDVAIEKFRKFATDYNVHVSLVVHPRKEDENVKLGISSFYGSAKATQEADTVLILQSDGKRKFVDVRKNRFDGTLGHVPLYFDRKSGRYTETDTNVASPPRTSVPQGVSAMGGVSSVRATYNDIRNQHPL
jgi:twinkle protein